MNDAARLRFLLSLSDGYRTWWAEEPYSFDSVPGRLPKDVLPIDYTIDIIPDAKGFDVFPATSRCWCSFRSATAIVQFQFPSMRLCATFAWRPVGEERPFSDDDHQLTTVTLVGAGARRATSADISYTENRTGRPRGLVCTKPIAITMAHRPAC